MQLPYAAQAKIEPAKIQQYLLSSTHPIGRAKARFFRRLGFTLHEWEDLRDALLVHARSGDATSSPTGRFGQKYVVQGYSSWPARARRRGEHLDYSKRHDGTGVRDGVP